MAEGAEIEAVPKSGGSKLVPVLLFVNMILVAAVLVVFLMRGGRGGAAKSPDGAPPAAEDAKGGAESGKAVLPGPTQKMADFVVHLRDPEADRYARVSFEVEVASEEEKARLAAYMPRVRDAFIAYLSDRTLEELRGSESITRTKTALAERLTHLAPGVNVRGLYITDLVIQ
ncbi:MAG TPA: flagellar basal body-associated FliL family protein [Anaeromyxobacter sp.]|nr:flagellar basal body-associated FliL family protein [Anaeromyxobacter sp.]